MRRKITAVLLIGAGFILAPAVLAAGPPSWIVPAALRFVSSPDDFFYNLHLDNVDYSPALGENPVHLRTNFLATTLPLSWLNLNAKGKVLNEGGINPWVPQVDITGAYGRIVMLEVIPSLASDEEEGDDIPEPSMTNYSLGLTLSKSVSPETRLFTGFHHSVVSLDVTLPGSVAIEISDDVTLDEIVVRRRDNILITGISNKLDENKTLTAYMGYGFNYNKIFSRLVWQRRRLELGFNIYPEGLLVVHPFLGWSWSF